LKFPFHWSVTSSISKSSQAKRNGKVILTRCNWGRGGEKKMVKEVEVYLAYLGSPDCCLGKMSYSDSKEGFE